MRRPETPLKRQRRRTSPGDLPGRAAGAKPEVVSQGGHLPGAQGHSTCHHVAPDLAGHLGHEQHLEEDAVLLPRGQHGQHGLHQIVR